MIPLKSSSLKKNSTPRDRLAKRNSHKPGKRHEKELKPKWSLKLCRRKLNEEKSLFPTWNKNSANVRRRFQVKRPVWRNSKNSCQNSSKPEKSCKNNWISGMSSLKNMMPTRQKMIKKFLILIKSVPRCSRWLKKKISTWVMSQISFMLPKKKLSRLAWRRGFPLRDFTNCLKKKTGLPRLSVKSVIFRKKKQRFRANMLQVKRKSTGRFGQTSKKWSRFNEMNRSVTDVPKNFCSNQTICWTRTGNVAERPKKSGKTARKNWRLPSVNSPCIMFSMVKRALLQDFRALFWQIISEA